MKFIFTLLFFLSFLEANLNKDQKLAKKYSQYDHLFQKYEEIYGVSKILMKAVAVTENGKFDKSFILQNTNNTTDNGLMQINSMWIKWMPKEKITLEKLQDVDFNIKIAFLIMKDLIDRGGYSWETVGRYHSGTPSLKKKWLKRIKRNMKMLARIYPEIEIRSSNINNINNISKTKTIYLAKI